MISDNITSVYASIRDAARSCGRSPEDIKLVAVSKRFGADSILEAQKAGQVLFGENYIQELQEKVPLTGNTVQFHFIGHLQSNKAKTAAQLCSMVETVDRKKLAKELNKHLKALHKKLDILIQVNIGNEQNKSGVAPNEAESLAHYALTLPHLRVKGLMTMPPFTPDPEDSRKYFREMKMLANLLAANNLFYDNEKVELSMGMTNDYLVAIQEGATLVRIGTAIFGRRPPKIT